MSSKRKKKAAGKSSGGERHKAPPLRMTTARLLVLTALAAFGYYLYSRVSHGFYQHDEVAHFLNMREFWYEPGVILGNWAKTGYKLAFAPVALAGPTALLAANCITAALCCYIAYRLAETLGSETPLVAFIFLALQPFWLHMSFRTYPEPFLALLVLGAMLMHYRDKPILAALLFSYSATIRQELYIFLALYGIYLVYRRKAIPALALLTFPLCYHVWGWFAKGDPAYLIHQLSGHSQRFMSAYPRHGFDHYFLMSLAIFGVLVLVFFIAYLALVVFYRKRPHSLILVFIGVYFLEHSIFNMKTIAIGPATGGVLRYLIILSPLLAVLAAIGAERLASFKDFSGKSKLAWFIVPFFIAVLIFMRFRHNNLVLTKVTDPAVVITTVIAVLLVFASLKRRALAVICVACAVGFALLTVRPIKRSNEDTIMLRVVKWARENRLESGPMLVNHPLFFYYQGRLSREFPNGAEEVTRERVEKAPVGTKIMWDSHYSYRPELRDTQVDFTYFMERPDHYRLMTKPRYFSDREFWMLVFEKIAD